MAAASASESAPPESATSTSGAFALSAGFGDSCDTPASEEGDPACRAGSPNPADTEAPAGEGAAGRTARTARRTSAIGGVRRGRRSAAASVDSSGSVAEAIK
ncbi:hypothetical protein GCM10009750_14770 [Agromyces salentinus]|uniref:Uncharacterized protein n=1 Tax=Agromyces salentinus TaxID=269421 RepID=A0ABN2MNC1_9MICO